MSKEHKKSIRSSKSDPKEIIIPPSASNPASVGSAATAAAAAEAPPKSNNNREADARASRQSKHGALRNSGKEKAKGFQRNKEEQTQGSTDNNYNYNNDNRSINDHDNSSIPGAVRMAGMDGDGNNNDEDDFNSNFLSAPFRNANQLATTDTLGDDVTLVEAQTVDGSEIQDLVKQGIQEYLAKQAVPAATVVEAKSVKQHEGEENNSGRKLLLVFLLVCCIVVVIALVVVVSFVVTGGNGNNNNESNPSSSDPPHMSATQSPAATYVPVAPSTPQPTEGDDIPLAPAPAPTPSPTMTRVEEFPPSSFTDISNIHDFDFSDFGYPIVRDPSTQGWLFDFAGITGSEVSFESSEIRTGLDRHIAYDCAERCQMEEAFAGAWNARDLLCWCFIEHRDSEFCLEPCIREEGIDFTSRPNDSFCLDSFCDLFAEFEPDYCEEYFDPEAETCIIEPFEVEDTGFDILHLVSGEDSPGFRNAISAITGGKTDYWNVEEDSPDASFPGAETFLPYQCVMVHAVNGFLQPSTLSDALADYVDAGGTVVMSSGVPTRLGCEGRLMDIDYCPVESTPDACARFESQELFAEGRIQFDEESHYSLFYLDIDNFRSNFYREYVNPQGEGIIKGYFIDGVPATVHRPDYRVVFLNAAYCIGGEFPNGRNCPGGAHVQRWVNACSLATYVAENGGNILA